MNAIETRALQYQAGRSFQIPGLDLHVPYGAIYGFLGPNGSGKTTTIRLILGLLRPRSGTMTVLGHSIPAAAPRALARIGYVPEQPHLDPTATVAETLRFQAAFYPTWDMPWAERLLQTFELDATRPFGRLSKGQKGKVMMLLALAQCPDLLVLDEPTDGLDPVVRRDIVAALIEYVSQRGATVFISSHLVHELERLCDWIGVMDGGRLVAELPTDRLKNGIKRLIVTGVPLTPQPLPFTVLSREADGGRNETWLVRGWESEMESYFAAVGASLQRVVDLDLEDGFVELLRSFRKPQATGGR
jgi:ABC-2 type transport system ATP-binding protein